MMQESKGHSLDAVNDAVKLGGESCRPNRSEAFPPKKIRATPSLYRTSRLLVTPAPLGMPRRLCLKLHRLSPRAKDASRLAPRGQLVCAPRVIQRVDLLGPDVFHAARTGKFIRNVARREEKLKGLARQLHPRRQRIASHLFQWRQHFARLSIVQHHAAALRSRQKKTNRRPECLQR